MGARLTGSHLRLNKNLSRAKPNDDSLLKMASRTSGLGTGNLADPFGAFRAQCEEALQKGYAAFQKKSGKPLPEVDLHSTLESPPDPSFGQLASSISFELSRTQKTNPMAIAKDIAIASAHLEQLPLVASVEAAEPGYVNFRVNIAKLADLTVGKILQEGSAYGLLKTDQPKRVIVEHTSANPARPIHIATAKGAFFGDALTRLLMARGHDTKARFYIDDAGRQVAIMAYGYRLLGEPGPKEKSDHFVGKIYSITAALVEVAEAKKRLELLRKTQASDLDMIAANKALDEWVGVAADLQAKYPAEFERLSQAVANDADPNVSVQELTQKYEKGEPATRELVRKVTQMVLNGHEETLRRAFIHFDGWDWEGDVLWSGRVAEVLDRLKETGFATNKGRSWEFDAARVVETFNLKEKLGVSPSFEVPPLTLTRSDGTTLYTARDIAYSMYKFEKADRVITVIGVEQSIAQFQLRVALWVLGHKKEAQNYYHFPIGIVSLEGQKMSARRGRYVTLDQVLDEAVARSAGEVNKRSADLSPDLRKRVAENIAISAVRYAVLSVEAAKSTNFVWDRALNFEANSAPFINYAYTRGLGILRKLGRIEPATRFERLVEPVERELVLQLAKFPETFATATDTLDPTQLCLYANVLAQRFHEFYEKVDISHLSDEELKRQRAGLVVAVRTVLLAAADLLGLRLAERM